MNRAPDNNKKINLSRPLHKMETMDMTSKKSKKKKKKKKKKTKKAAACSAADLMEQLAVVQKKEGQETVHVCVCVCVCVCVLHHLTRTVCVVHFFVRCLGRWQI